MPVTMGGMASGVDTDSIINKLVEVESQPIKQLQRGKYLNNQKKEALKKLSSQLKELEGKARDLYGFRASYDEKKAVSSDTTVIEATASKQADSGSNRVEVLQLASYHKITTDAIEYEKKLPSGKFSITVNGIEKKINFRGGGLKSLNEAIREEADEIVATDYISTDGTKYVISLTSKVPGKKGEIGVKGSEELLKAAGLINGEKIKSKDDFPVVFDRKFFSSYSGDKKPEDQDGTIDVGKEGKEVTVKGELWQEYELPFKADIKKETILKFSFTYSKEEEEKVPLKVETGPEDEINVKGIKLKSYNISRIRPLSKKEEKKFDSALGIGIISSEDGKRLEKIYPIEKDAAKNQEIPVGRDFEGKQALKLVLYCSDGSAVFIEPVLSTPIKAKGDFELKNTIANAENAKLKVEGLEIERDRNEGLNDVIKGVTLNLKRKSEYPVELKVSPDLDKPVQKIKDFVETYNKYLELHKALTKAVKVEKPGESEKLQESGLFMGDMALVRLENSLKTTIGASYPARVEKPVKMFNQMGVSTGRVNSSWESIKEGKLIVEEDELRRVIVENPDGVKEFFGSDIDGDNKTDNGMAYTLVKTLNPYISSGKNIIESKIDFEDNSIKMANERITRQELHIKQFEEKLRKKFAVMERSISGAKAQQSWMKNQMGGGGGQSEQ
ncbi:MAG TPA: flagellar filament capping protein FliD [Spirochaetota bacterium]|nr:flagellar filament capping protein FliD [Spirochaetota bacterium]HPF05211.1 flagellar filament capping protein FliD [Spirochaetota bacterium]HPJ41910.1 flagellar filament capping protein FliD [Spirochaetota bacterium]HPR38739.1 flagellar filament capping protein FliD [Spirochaetota bacterium]